MMDYKRRASDKPKYVHKPVWSDFLIIFAAYFAYGVFALWMYGEVFEVDIPSGLYPLTAVIAAIGVIGLASLAGEEP